MIKELRGNNEEEAVCLFEKSCLILGGDTHCQMNTAVNTFFKSRRKLIQSDGKDTALDAILTNKLFLRCPYYFEISDFALDRINDPARYRRRQLKLKSPNFVT